MIEITDSAQEYFARLISQQEMDDIGLHLSVLNPGTPNAACDLQFHAPGGSAGNGSSEPEQTFTYDSFNLYVPYSSERWLTDAKIDFEKDDAGGQLTIKAPGIKGSEPEEDADLADKINWILNAEINPGLASHGGRVELEEITPEKDVVLRFGGGCHGCGMVSVTLKEGIEKTLQQHFPEINSIIDATDHSTGDNPYYK